MRKKKSDWWEEFLPRPNESNKQYVDRMCDTEMHFVMKQVSNIELAQLAAAYEIAGFRFGFLAGHYAILVIRDIVFCAYGTDFDPTDKTIA